MKRLPLSPLVMVNHGRKGHCPTTQSRYAFLFLGAFTVLHCAAADYKPPEVVIQHISTVFAGQGMCAVRFSVETAPGDGDAGSVIFSLLFRDKNNRTVARGELTAELSDSTAGRYQEPILEGEDFCLLDPATRVVVVKARSQHEGKKYDLLKLKKTRVSDFKPYEITLGVK